MFPQARSLTRACIRYIGSVVQKECFDEICLKNEPVLEYLPKSVELLNLRKALEGINNNCEEIPIVINGKEMSSRLERYQVLPQNHATKIAKFYYAERKFIYKAINAAMVAQEKWDRTELKHRVQIWEHAADLMATKYRAALVAATMLGQGKTIFEAEIDAAAQLIDFVRLNAAFLQLANGFEPTSENPDITKNHLRFRGLEGFVAAISPFNFTSRGGNLAYTPALMGNGVVWKPADAAVLANWRIFQIMREAGVPDGLVNFVPADRATFGQVVTSSEFLAGINFTGTTSTFNGLCKMVGSNIDTYKNFPRLIGECGGKNFHFVHETADVSTVIGCTVRAAFEYSGQKSSACSRLYVPESLWASQLKVAMIEQTCKLKLGDVRDIDTFLSAVINEEAFQRISRYLWIAKTRDSCQIVVGGCSNNLKGYFVQPTIIEVSDPKEVFFKDEIFGPILAVYVYPNAQLEQTMDLVVNTSKYALTGAVFGQDEEFLSHALQKFKMAAGNFYINDKCTGSVVGQQPFGGTRMSGTNDKVGGPHYILRWTTPQSIKESFTPITNVYYPYMGIC